MTTTSSMPTSHVKPALEILKAILVIANGIAAFIILSLVEPAALAVLPTDRLQALFAFVHHAILDGAFLYAAWCFMTAALARKANRFDLALVRFSPRIIVWLIPGIVCVIIAQIIWIGILTAFNVPSPVDDWGLPALYTTMPLSFATFVFILCAIAPFCEEILFRGVLFRWLTTKLPPMAAVLISAFVFAVFHFSIIALASTFVLGVVNALLVRRSGSVWPGILLHALNNALFVITVLPR
ncbi:MAG: CPBP family intramembrane metalloprotease [Chloroflexi bacterium]|nr:CPBP family intramembrane metalloprotease [Chloroflexota bacterium]